MTQVPTDGPRTPLLDAVVAVSSDLDLAQVLSRIVRSACELVDATYGALGVIAPEGERLVEFITHGLSADERSLIGDPPHGRGVLGLLIEDPRPRRMKDIMSHPDSYGFPPNHPPMHSFLGAPISIRGEVYGNLYMSEKRSAPEFTEDDEQVLVALAAAAGVAIENARLYDRTRRQRGLADAIGEMTQGLLEGGQPGDALRLMAVRCTELTSAELSVIALYDADRRLVVEATSAEPPDQAVGDTLGAGRWDDIVAEGSPLLLVSREGETPAPEVEAIRRLGAPGAPGPTAVVAISVGESALGVLAVTWGADDDGTAADSLEALRSFGRTAALALEASTAQRDRGRMELLEDRDRIARDMHDHVIQRLFATGLSLQSASRLSADARVRERLDSAVDELDDAIKDIRQTIFGLHRPIGGLGMSSQVAELVQQAAASLGFTPEVEPPTDWDALTPDLEAEVLAVVREGLANVVRHAEASWCRLRIEVTDQVTVLVEDDGVGVAEGDHARSGLANLTRRAERSGGTLSIRARSGGGTLVSWQVPLPSPR
ncbi:sensor histidine kinase [Angustibacter luteus]|uniref:GAF domain-containing sensor histidine kinase n=1 Tax=Angustibacter luteus TaxID=658456 RepID=A0ABW1JHM5_9ACTN